MGAKTSIIWLVPKDKYQLPLIHLISIRHKFVRFLLQASHSHQPLSLPAQRCNTALRSAHSQQKPCPTESPERRLGRQSALRMLQPGQEHPETKTPPRASSSPSVRLPGSRGQSYAARHLRYRESPKAAATTSSRLQSAQQVCNLPITASEQAQRASCLRV